MVRKVKSSTTTEKKNNPSSISHKQGGKVVKRQPINTSRQAKPTALKCPNCSKQLLNVNKNKSGVCVTCSKGVTNLVNKSKNIGISKKSNSKYLNSPKINPNNKPNNALSSKKVLSPKATNDKSSINPQFKAEPKNRARKQDSTSDSMHLRGNKRNYTQLVKGEIIDDEKATKRRKIDTNTEPLTKRVSRNKTPTVKGSEWMSTIHSKRLSSKNKETPKKATRAVTNKSPKSNTKIKNYESKTKIPTKVSVVKRSNKTDKSTDSTTQSARKPIKRPLNKNDVKNQTSPNLTNKKSVVKITASSKTLKNSPKAKSKTLSNVKKAKADSIINKKEEDKNDLATSIKKQFSKCFSEKQSNATSDLPLSVSVAKDISNNLDNCLPTDNVNTVSDNVNSCDLYPVKLPEDKNNELVDTIKNVETLSKQENNENIVNSLNENACTKLSQDSIESSNNDSNKAESFTNVVIIEEGVLSNKEIENKLNTFNLDEDSKKGTISGNLLNNASLGNQAKKSSTEIDQSNISLENKLQKESLLKESEKVNVDTYCTNNVSNDIPHVTFVNVKFENQSSPQKTSSQNFKDEKTIDSITKYTETEKGSKKETFGNQVCQEVSEEKNLSSKKDHESKTVDNILASNDELGNLTIAQVSHDIIKNDFVKSSVSDMKISNECNEINDNVGNEGSSNVLLNTSRPLNESVEDVKSELDISISKLASVSPTTDKTSINTDVDIEFECNMLPLQIENSESDSEQTNDVPCTSDREIDCIKVKVTGKTTDHHSSKEEPLIYIQSENDRTVKNINDKNNEIEEQIPINEENKCQAPTTLNNCTLINDSNNSMENNFDYNSDTNTALPADGIIRDICTKPLKVQNQFDSKTDNVDISCANLFNHKSGEEHVGTETDNDVIIKQRNKIVGNGIESNKLLSDRSCEAIKGSSKSQVKDAVKENTGSQHGDTALPNDIKEANKKICKEQKKATVKDCSVEAEKSSSHNGSHNIIANITNELVKESKYINELYPEENINITSTLTKIDIENDHVLTSSAEHDKLSHSQTESIKSDTLNKEHVTKYSETGILNETSHQKEETEYKTNFCLGAKIESEMSHQRSHSTYYENVEEKNLPRTISDHISSGAGNAKNSDQDDNLAQTISHQTSSGAENDTNAHQVENLAHKISDQLRSGIGNAKNTDQDKNLAQTITDEISSGVENAKKTDQDEKLARTISDQISYGVGNATNNDQDDNLGQKIYDQISSGVGNAKNTDQDDNVAQTISDQISSGVKIATNTDEDDNVAQTMSNQISSGVGNATNTDQDENLTRTISDEISSGVVNAKKTDQDDNLSQTIFDQISSVAGNDKNTDQDDNLAQTISDQLSSGVGNAKNTDQDDNLSNTISDHISSSVGNAKNTDQDDNLAQTISHQISSGAGNDKNAHQVENLAQKISDQLSSGAGNAKKTDQDDNLSQTISDQISSVAGNDKNTDQDDNLAQTISDQLSSGVGNAKNTDQDDNLSNTISDHISSSVGNAKNTDQDDNLAQTISHQISSGAGNDKNAHQVENLAQKISDQLSSGAGNAKKTDQDDNLFQTISDQISSGAGNAMKTDQDENSARTISDQLSYGVGNATNTDQDDNLAQTISDQIISGVGNAKNTEQDDSLAQTMSNQISSGVGNATNTDQYENLTRTISNDISSVVVNAKKTDQDDNLFQTISDQISSGVGNATNTDQDENLTRTISNEISSGVVNAKKTDQDDNLSQTISDQISSVAGNDKNTDQDDNLAQTISDQLSSGVGNAKNTDQDDNLSHTISDHISSSVVNAKNTDQDDNLAKTISHLISPIADSPEIILQDNNLSRTETEQISSFGICNGHSGTSVNLPLAIENKTVEEAINVDDDVESMQCNSETQSSNRMSIDEDNIEMDIDSEKECRSIEMNVDSEIMNMEVN